MILYFAIGLMPILAGLDKLFQVVGDWDMYLAPQISQLLPLSEQAIMMAAGVVEVIAGLI